MPDPSPLSSFRQTMKSNKDEANGERHVDGTNHGASEDTGSSQDKDNHNNCNGDADVDGVGDSNVNGDVHADVDDKVDDDDEEMVDRCARGNHAGDCIVVDWLKGEYCIECNSRSGQVLACSENGCPVAFHEACMTWKPKFDDMGKFYCPYCLFKQEVARLEELRMEAKLAEKELSNFICLRRDDRSEEKQEGEMVNVIGANVSTMAREVSSGDCGNELNDGGKETIHHNQDETRGVESISKEKFDEQNISRAHGFDNAGNGERVQEDIENSSDSEDEEIGEDRRQIRPSSSSHVGIVEDTLHVSTKETSDIVGVLEENQGEREKEEPVLPNAVGTTMLLISTGATSKVPAVESFDFVSPDLDTETLVVGPKHDKQTANEAPPLKVVSPDNSSFQPSTTANNMNMNQEGKTVTAKNSVERPKSTKRLMIPIVGTEKRRRLHWTTEEEDMLKELVRTFSTKVNKNIPWRKILEYGRSVFHSTRLPADLKDKWKNIVAKEISKR